MPQAQPPTPPRSPAPLSNAESVLIKGAVTSIFGEDAVVRNCGPDPLELWLHVEANDVEEQRVSELLGLLYAKIARDRIVFSSTRRGSRISGIEKIAYRQGVVL
jgi:hypothetical protein